MKARGILNFTTQLIPFHDGWRKKSIFEEAVFKFEMKNIIYIPCKVWSG